MKSNFVWVNLMRNGCYFQTNEYLSSDHLNIWRSIYEVHWHPWIDPDEMLFFSDPILFILHSYHLLYPRRRNSDKISTKSTMPRFALIDSTKLLTNGNVKIRMWTLSSVDRWTFIFGTVEGNRKNIITVSVLDNRLNIWFNMTTPDCVIQSYFLSYAPI